MALNTKHIFYWKFPLTRMTLVPNQLIPAALVAPSRVLAKQRHMALRNFRAKFETPSSGTSAERAASYSNFGRQGCCWNIMEGCFTLQTNRPANTNRSPKPMHAVVVNSVLGSFKTIPYLLLYDPAHLHKPRLANAWAWFEWVMFSGGSGPYSQDSARILLSHVPVIQTDRLCW